MLRKIVINELQFFSCATWLIRLEQSLRDFCLKLMSSVEYLPELGEESTFTLQIQTNEISSHEFNSIPQYEVMICF